MKAYKGFNKDMKCRGFQFEEGKSYEEKEASLCENGFHACENPIDVFSYYAPGNSVYREIELSDVCETHEKDSKVCGKKIQIGAEISLRDMIRAVVKIDIQSAKKATSDNHSHAATSGNYSPAATSGDHSHAATSGDYSPAATSWERFHRGGNWKKFKSKVIDWKLDCACRIWRMERKYISCTVRKVCED